MTAADAGDKPTRGGGGGRAAAETKQLGVYV